MKNYRLSHLEELEAESIFVLRETFAQFDNPCILFSGGKDSIVVTQLAVKAFAPANIPFTLLHIDTGHNFEETLLFRDQLVEELGVKLIIGSVEASINSGKVAEEKGIYASRNRAQSVTLLEMIEKHQFDAAIGGARRDEEKARAKERFFSHRDEFGQWDPKNQRPELWNIFNGKKQLGEHFRVFPISNWTELDIWQYIQQENIALPSLYFTHEREIIRRGDTLLANSPFIQLRDDELVTKERVRFRTIGDLTITGAIESEAHSIEDIIKEVATAKDTERGNRADDQRSESSMEDRKREGYF
ncbi:MAG: sulfate adenylyltransferase subunit CysD [Crocinitomicaceae bacterium]|nr:sulfate adenylyltransferase subunit CysD [Crocinitomicaceae bacterium]MCF8410616.1 sulfate adenylyltransferase subunit CysD [Crocinitomicaceae bacterium]MCF8444075.1 sulfate adenylyltransferase subunit CysD [Crocinitomicaceae bacterium]